MDGKLPAPVWRVQRRSARRRRSFCGVGGERLGIGVSKRFRVGVCLRIRVGVRDRYSVRDFCPLGYRLDGTGRCFQRGVSCAARAD
jgi:hypothetical protein